MSPLNFSTKKFISLRLIRCVALFAVFVFAVAAENTYAVGTHLNRSVLPDGCASCHQGHGVRGSAMLTERGGELCFQCHGSAKAGTRGEARSDVERALHKRSYHPVSTTAKYHSQGELLPERRASLERHVACADCHDVHRVRPQNPFGHVTGYTGSQMVVKRVTAEYEVCYKCHSDSANMPPEGKNLRLLFDRLNASYHPVERPGRNGDVPSLVPGLTPSSRVTCSDCHGNNDLSGARGPHGSDYDSLLKYNYQTTDSGESPFAYELCYRCHDRGSILSDKSFRKHSLHILFSGASCITCHDSHGSPLYPHLIEFNPNVVSNDSMGRRVYMQGVAGKPECFLSCHGVEHNEGFYTTRGW